MLGLSNRLFYRLFAIALPGLITVLLVSTVGLFAFSLLGAQMAAMQSALNASATADSLSGRFDNLITNLDELTIPGNQYNSIIYAESRRGVLSDSLVLKNLDVSFASGTAGQRERIVTAIEGVLPELDALNNLSTSDLNARFVRWTGGLRERVVLLDNDVHSLAEEWRTDAQGVVDEAGLLFSWGRLGIILFGLLAVATSLGVAVLFTSRIMRPIRRLKVQMEGLAAGDLSAAASLVVADSKRSSRDELEALEGVYQSTILTLRPMIDLIQKNAQQISSSAGEIATTAGHQAQNAGDQAAAIGQVTVTVEQLTQTAAQIAEAAVSVSDSAEQALISANRGQDAVRDSIIGMAMIRSRVNDITSRILALSEQSQRISDIIDVIDDMAARTHILALNAAVESAAAGGVAGQRFGVVAGEVKKLAQRSAAATREVRAVIAQVQAATNAAVMATEDGLKETEKGVQTAHQSGDANEDIIQLVERTVQLAQAINLATQQQRTASEQVVETMRQIADVTRQTAGGSRHALDAAAHLTGIAHGLQEVTGGFRVESVAEVKASEGVQTR